MQKMKILGSMEDPEDMLLRYRSKSILRLFFAMLSSDIDVKHDPYLKGA